MVSHAIHISPTWLAVHKTCRFSPIRVSVIFIPRCSALHLPPGSVAFAKMHSAGALWEEVHLVFVCICIHDNYFKSTEERFFKGIKLQKGEPFVHKRGEIRGAKFCKLESRWMGEE